MICTNCTYRMRVESTEVGVVIDQCDEFKVDLRKLGNVKTCSSFEAKDTPYLFAHEAWRISKDDEGDLVFTDPTTEIVYKNGKPVGKRKKRTINRYE